MADETLPNVDLGPILKDIQESQSKEEPPQKQESPLGHFKSSEDMVKAYKEIQAFSTKVSQENAELKKKMAELDQLKEQLELAPPPIYPQQQYQQPQQPNGNPDLYTTFNTMRIAEVLVDEASKDRTQFNERYAYAQAVSQQYPHLAQTARGVQKLFELGDRLRSENLKKNAGRALESIFGEPLTEEDTARLRTLVKGDKAITQKPLNTNAYMPDTSTSTKSGSDQNQNPNFDIELKESVKKGDVDGTISALFKKQLAE